MSYLNVGMYKYHRALHFNPIFVWGSSLQKVNFTCKRRNRLQSNNAIPQGEGGALTLKGQNAKSPTKIELSYSYFWHNLFSFTLICLGYIIIIWWLRSYLYDVSGSIFVTEVKRRHSSYWMRYVSNPHDIGRILKNIAKTKILDRCSLDVLTYQKSIRITTWWTFSQRFYRNRLSRQWKCQYSRAASVVSYIFSSNKMFSWQLSGCLLTKISIFDSVKENYFVKTDTINAEKWISVVSLILHHIKPLTWSENMKKMFSKIYSDFDHVLVQMMHFAILVNHGTTSIYSGSMWHRWILFWNLTVVHGILSQSPVRTALIQCGAQ